MKRKAKEFGDHRKLNGIDVVPDVNIGNSEKDPGTKLIGLGYVDKPKFQSSSAMKAFKKKVLMDENDKSYWKSKPDQHKTEN